MSHSIATILQIATLQARALQLNTWSIFVVANNLVLTLRSSPGHSRQNLQNSCTIERPSLFLSSIESFLILQSEYHRRIIAQNERSKQAFLATVPSPTAEILLEDGFRSRNGTTALKSAKIRSLFQWGRSRQANRSSRPPPPGKGKPEDDSQTTGRRLSGSRRDSEATSASGASPTPSCRGWSSRKSSRSNDHDDGPDWDW